MGNFFRLSYNYKITSKAFCSTLPDAINTTLLPNVTSEISGCTPANLHLFRMGDIVNKTRQLEPFNANVVT